MGAAIAAPIFVFNLRIPPGLHGRIAIQAKAEGKSINQWVSEILDESVAGGVD
jgi:predicted HicB family RNase H-like nuclease